MKNKMTFSIIILLGILFTGCSRAALLSIVTSRDDQDYRKMVDKVFDALDQGNKEVLKNLFAPNAINANPNIDQQIDMLFEFYDGPYSIDEKISVSHSSEHNDHGRKEIYLQSWFEISANGSTYHMYLDMISRNDNDKQEEGIRILDFATDEAYKSKYFIWHSEENTDDVSGIYIQTSPEIRSDIMMVDDLLLKYKPINRSLCTDDFLDVITKDDSFQSLTDLIGEANGSNLIYGMFYYELDHNQFVVCHMTDDKVKYLNVADEDKELHTLWSADDIIKINGSYLPYTPIDRKLTETDIISFLKKSTDMDQFLGKFGPPNVDNTFYYYYTLSDGNYIIFHLSGHAIDHASVADSEDILYTIWDENDDLQN